MPQLQASFSFDCRTANDHSGIDGTLILDWLLVGWSGWADNHADSGSAQIS
jgi:hypothetical protein